MNDLISRQDAIDEIEKHTRLAQEPYLLSEFEKGLNWGLDVAISITEQLPSADASLIQDRCKIDASSDLISRQDAIDAIRASTSKYTGFMEMEMYTDDDAVEAIEGVSPAQSERKTGRWIERQVTDGKCIWQSARCSACGKYHTTPYMYYIVNYNYCPNCGARMREVEHED